MDPIEAGREFGNWEDWGWVLAQFLYLVALVFGLVRGAIAVEDKGRQWREKLDKERERWML